MTRLAVFDCDGTLVDSQHAICAAMAAAFAQSRLNPPSRAATLQVVGLSLDKAMQTLMPEAESDLHDQLVCDYKAAFQQLRAQGGVNEPLYDGIAELIDTLFTQGWALGIATGKSDRGLRHCLARHGLSGHFMTLQTADRHPSKPHPSMIRAAMAEAGAEPAATIMIGDTSFDMAMARAADAKAIGAAWGYHSVDELVAAGAHSVALAPSELLHHMEFA